METTAEGSGFRVCGVAFSEDARSFQLCPASGSADTGRTVRDQGPTNKGLGFRVYTHDY